jgi:outer membrane protein assembly factor BamE (lipoprotein component of BamABCDE complex)
MKIIVLLIIPFTLLNSCASDTKKTASNPFNPIAIKESLHSGSTKQKEVLNTFGAPNITSTGSDKSETWVYSKSSMKYSDDTFGIGSVPWPGVPVVGNIFGSKSSAEINSHSVNLTLTFNSKKILQEYKIVRTQM